MSPRLRLLMALKQRLIDGGRSPTKGCKRLWKKQLRFFVCVVFCMFSKEISKLATQISILLPNMTSVAIVTTLAMLMSLIYYPREWVTWHNNY